MVLKSFAKINLTLSVTNKFVSGLHNIQSIYCLVDVFDSVILKKNTKKDKVSFKGPYSKYVNRSNNSIKTLI